MSEHGSSRHWRRLPCDCPEPATHRLGGGEQRGRLSRFRRPEVWNQGVAGPYSFRGLKGWIFPASPSCWWPQVLRGSVHVTPCHLPMSSHGLVVHVPVSSPLLPLIVTLVIGFRAHLDSQASLISSPNLITTVKTLFPNKVTSTRSEGQEVDILYVFVSAGVWLPISLLYSSDITLIPPPPPREHRRVAHGHVQWHLLCEGHRNLW